MPSMRAASGERAGASDLVLLYTATSSAARI
jgi:hypothetical protein